jgi:hypothetical protein
MKTQARRSPADRDNAVARLRAISIGTTVVSLAAVGGFGAVAAASYDGSAPEVMTAAVVTTDATTDSTSAAATAAPTLQRTSAPTTATGKGHASTGSS